MKYFLDTEFLEGTQKKRFLGIPYGDTLNTIDLISIGIVAEDSREYYAISKEFNLKEAWNRYQMKQVSGDARNRFPEGVKEYWIRENVLKPIFDELLEKYNQEYKKALKKGVVIGTIINDKFSYKLLKYLINRYGKTNLQIANEIVEFVYGKSTNKDGLSPLEEAQRYKPNPHISLPEFYAYYADYDWVAFCWIFGKMIDLPKGFPMYCRDLKQMLDDKADDEITRQCYNSGNHTILTLEQAIDSIKKAYNYPKQDSSKAHNALEDARWNKKLYQFLKSL